MNHDETHAASLNILLRTLEELVPPQFLNELLNHAGRRTRLPESRDAKI
jgi:hypothetical protein